MSWRCNNRHVNPVTSFFLLCRTKMIFKLETYKTSICRKLSFRPWTLLTGDTQVPHLSLLGLSKQSLETLYGGVVTRRSKHSKSELNKIKLMKTADNNEASVISQSNWAAAWDEYARGNVVSESSANLIRSFLLKTIAASGKVVDNNESEADESEPEGEIAPLRLPRGKLQELLKPTLHADESHSMQETSNSVTFGIFVDSCQKKENATCI